MDKIHVKTALTYHGGRDFGKAIDFPDDFAIMVECLFGRPEFIDNIYPIQNLKAQFLMMKEAELWKQ